MIGDMFDNVNLLEKGLDASWLKNQAITNNIANADTPGFKASHVEFESVFKAALQDDGFKAKITNPKHIDFSGSEENITPIVTTDTNTTYRMDGNNVDIEYENLELAKNTIYYNELSTQLSSELNKIKTVING